MRGFSFDRRDGGRRLTVTVLVVLILAGACTSSGSVFDAAPTSTETPGATTTVSSPRSTTDDRDPAVIRPGLPRFDEGPCPIGEPRRIELTCGALTVAEDRQDPSSPEIRLAVAVLHADTDTPAPDPLVYLEGGPGGSALTGLEFWVGPISPFLKARDVILVDQRGTGYSQPSLSCEEDLETSDDDLNGYRSCYERLNGFADLTQYNTAENAADIADLRVAMGLDQINLYGVSYGTRLALVTMTLYPEGIRSAILDSVYPPNIAGLEEQAPNAAESLRLVLAACENDTGCRDRFGDLDTLLYETVDRLNTDPAEISDIDELSGEDLTVDMTGDDLVDSIFGGLYSAETIADLPRIIELASRGDMQEAYDLLNYGYRAPRRQETAPDDSDGLYYSAECAEQAPLNDRQAVIDNAEALPEPLQDGLVNPALFDMTVCKLWQVGQATRPALPDVDSEIPALLVAGTFDPITPPHLARLAGEGLPNSTYVEIPDAGHGAIDAGPCGLAIALDFVDDPIGPLDLSCLERQGPIEFNLE